VGIIFQPFGTLIPAAVNNDWALGAYEPWFLKNPDLYGLAGISNTVVTDRVYGNLVVNG